MIVSLTCSKCGDDWVSEGGRCVHCGHDVIDVRTDDDTLELSDD